MAICKFFQQGSCRFGQSCRYEHVYSSKYSYHSNAPPQAASSTPAVTDDQLINQLHSDVQAVLRGGQWILSSYAPLKEKPTFPGLTDLSPEEARLFIYEAKASNNLDQAVDFMNNLFKEARTKYEQLLLKNTNITRVLRSLYKGENVASPFENISQENSVFNSASSVFKSAVQSTPFAQYQTPSVFTQSNATPSIFSQNNTDPAKSIFAQATQNSFTNQNTNLWNANNQNVFAPASGFTANPVQNNTDMAKSIFAQDNQNQNANIWNANNQNVFGPADATAKSVFAQATQNAFTATNPQNDAANLFATQSQSVFHQNQSTAFSNPTNIFQTQSTQNTFNTQQNVFQQATGDLSYYSKEEDLSPEDLDAFNNNDFKLGFVPEVPPPHSLCF